DIPFRYVGTSDAVSTQILTLILSTSALSPEQHPQFSPSPGSSPSAPRYRRSPALLDNLVGAHQHGHRLGARGKVLVRAPDHSRGHGAANRVRATPAHPPNTRTEQCARRWPSSPYPSSCARSACHALMSRAVNRPRRAASIPPVTSRQR